MVKELITSCFILYCKWLKVMALIWLADSCVEVLAETSEELAGLRVLEGVCRHCGNE